MPNKPAVRVSSAAFSNLEGFMKDREAQEAELSEKFGPNYTASSRTTFSLNVAEEQLVKEWVESLQPEIMSLQQGKFDNISPDEPYYGAIGGGLTYSFTPTGVGVVKVVRESITGKELNISDALDWYFF